VPVRKQPTRIVSRKRKRVDTFEDIVLGVSETDYVPVQRQFRQKGKKDKEVNGKRDIALEKLVQMQEELSKMIAAYQQERGVA
jgi:hypothetical protein